MSIVLVIRVGVGDAGLILLWNIDSQLADVNQNMFKDLLISSMSQHYLTGSMVSLKRLEYALK